MGLETGVYINRFLNKKNKIVNLHWCPFSQVISAATYHIRCWLILVFHCSQSKLYVQGKAFHSLTI